MNKKTEIIYFPDIQYTTNIQIDSIIRKHKPTSVFSADSGSKTKKRIYHLKEVL